MKISLTFQSGQMHFEAVAENDFERRMLAAMSPHALLAHVDKQYSDGSGRVVLVVRKAELDPL